MMQYLLLFFGLILGLLLGRHDSTNAFGTAVATRVVRFRTSVLINAVMIILGCLLFNRNILNHLNQLTTHIAGHSAPHITLIMICTGCCILGMRLFKLPFSVNQAFVGAIIGRAIFQQEHQRIGMLRQIIDFPIAWLLTPVIAAIFSWLLIYFLKPYLETKMSSIQVYDWTIRIGYLLSGSLCAFSIGQNSATTVATLFFDTTVTGFFAQPWLVTLFSGLSIALGVLFFSRKTTVTTGTSIVKVSQMDGFLLIFAAAMAVLLVGNAFVVPVSSSQALIGGVLGAGFASHSKHVNYKALTKILVSWLSAPLLAGILSFAAAWIMTLLY